MEGLTSLGFQVGYEPDISQEAVEHSIHLYSGLIVSTRIKASESLLKDASLLRFIARAGSGMENIDVAYAKTKNIVCINSPEGNANSVGEHAIGLLLAFYHNIATSYLELQESKWLVQENRVHELEGRTVGIIGYGNTGKSFAKKLSSFDMEVMAFDKYLRNYSDEFAREASMDVLFERCEIISLHVPLTPETFKMVNADFLNRFKEKIKGAALDVYENEKFETHTTLEQQVFHELLHSRKVIVTPHVAGKSFESKKKIAEVLLRKIKEILNVKPLS
jgi:D-3-phosphoglycerate dehydrogenase